MERITLGYPHPYREIDGSVFLMRMATQRPLRSIGLAGTAITVHAYNGPVMRSGKGSEQCHKTIADLSSLGW